MLTGRRHGGTRALSWPSISIRPQPGASNPASMRSSVVFPQPDGPSSAKNSPRRMSSETPSTAWTSPYRLVTSTMRTRGAGSGGRATRTRSRPPSTAPTPATLPASAARGHGLPDARDDPLRALVVGLLGVEALHQVVRRVGVRVLKELLLHERLRGRDRVRVGDEVGRLRDHLGLEDVVEEGVGVLGIGRVLRHRHHVEPDLGTLLGDLVLDLDAVLRLLGTR